MVHVESGIVPRAQIQVPISQFVQQMQLRSQIRKWPFPRAIHQRETTVCSRLQEGISPPLRHRSTPLYLQHLLTSHWRIRDQECSIKQLSRKKTRARILSPTCALLEAYNTNAKMGETIFVFLSRALSNIAPSSFSNKPIRASPTSP